MSHNRLLAFVILWLLGAASASAQPLISTVAGGGPNNAPAIATNLPGPRGVAIGPGGNYFITAQNRVFRVDTTGFLTVVAGNGTPGFSGDGGPATSAQFAGTRESAVDASGNLFIADTYNNRIRRVDAATGVITTAAGNGTPGFCGDGGPATSACLNDLWGVAVDAAGNLLIADTLNYRIRRVDARTGIITTVAGNGIRGFSGDGGPAASASLNDPTGVAADAAGNLFVADSENHRIRRVDARTGIITTVAGNGIRGFSGDGGPATSASLNNAYTVAVDASGSLFIADSFNVRIRRVDAATGIITTVAGGGTGDLGDGGPATSATLSGPEGVAVDGSGNLFLTDYNRIRRVDAATGIISTVAGNGEYGFGGDGGDATSASIYPEGVAVDASGNLFIAGSYRIRRVDAATGIITTVAGGGTGDLGDGGPATSATLTTPTGVAVDASGNLFIVDYDSYRIRRVDAATGIITTVAGNGAPSFSGDGGPATSASLNYPVGVAVDASGNLLIADTYNYRIRRVDAATGIITTVAGGGTGGDGGPATSASLDRPLGVVVDAAGNLFIADTSNYRIRRVDAATGIITTAAGNGEFGFGGDGGPATSASLRRPQAVAVDASGNLFIADTENYRIRRVDAATGIITTAAGNGPPGFCGDGGPATSACLNIPTGVAVDASRRLFIADRNNVRIRLVQ